MKGLLSAFITTLYLMMISFTALIVLTALEYEGIGNTLFVVGVWVFGVISCILGFANFVLGIVKIFRPKKSPYKTVMICKLILVPFFVMNFIYLVLIFLGSLNIFLIWMLPIVIFLTILTYGILLATSVYNIGYLIHRLTHREGAVLEQIIFIVLHFLYVIDVVASVVLYVKNKNTAEAVK